MASTNSLSFQELKKGMHVRVIAVVTECVCAQRLQEMGLTSGAEFLVTKVAPFGDPIEIELRGSRLCLRKCDTCYFEIQVIDPSLV